MLSGHGLGVALESLAAGSAVPVKLNVSVEKRLDESIEVAAYYVVTESLANIGKHAHASIGDRRRRPARATSWWSRSSTTASAAPTASAGTGLRGLADRVEALGGRLRVWTPSGGGTRVRAEMPCA